MMQWKKQFSVIVVLSLLGSLSGCQQTPENGVVVSRNDGAFDANVIVSASESHEPDETQNVERFETFYSSDGSVEFRMEIQESLTNRNMPVVEVEPHFLTEEDVRRVAYVLFGDADFYESQPILDEKLSKQDIREKIERWSPYTNADALRELYGNAAGQREQLELVKTFIEKYTTLYDVAPEKLEREPCRWEFRKSSYYIYPAGTLSGSSTQNDNDKISVSVKANGVVYAYSASIRNKEDYKLSSISMHPSDGTSPGAMDGRIFRATLCRTAEPTEAQIAAIREKAANMLEEMELGDWLIDECYVETKWYGEIAEYIVHVNAVPVFNGSPAVRQPQLTNLKSEETYASNFYLTNVNMEFSANGEIYTFELDSPVDIKQTLNDNVEVMSMESLMAIARNYFVYSDAYNYGFGAALDTVGEEVSCVVHIQSLGYNLTRVKVPDTDESYYYIPGITLHGSVEYTGKDSGDLYFSSENIPLLSLNGVDGSMVQTVG